MKHTCDRCGIYTPAAFVWECKTGGGKLYFCLHHSREYGLELVKGGFHPEVLE